MPLNPENHELLELADMIYGMVIEGLVLLGANPVQCAAVGMLREFTFLLLVLLGVAVIIHVIVVLWLARSSRPVGDPRLTSILQACVNRSGLHYVPRLLEPPANAPLAFTAGGRRGAIYLSSRLSDTLDDAETEAVILHELAHLRERDHLFTSWFRVLLFVSFSVLMQALILAYFFGSSALHFGSFRAQIVFSAVAAMYLLSRTLCWKPLRHLRETDCDDVAVQWGAQPQNLASALVKTAKLRLTLRRNRRKDFLVESALIPVSAGLELRVRRLLNPRKRIFRARVLLRRIVLAAILCLFLFAADFHLRSAESANPPTGWAQIALP